MSPFCFPSCTCYSAAPLSTPRKSLLPAPAVAEAAGLALGLRLPARPGPQWEQLSIQQEFPPHGLSGHRSSCLCPGIAWGGGETKPQRSETTGKLISYLLSWLSNTADLNRMIILACVILSAAHVIFPFPRNSYSFRSTKCFHRTEGFRVLCCNTSEC